MPISSEMEGLRACDAASIRLRHLRYFVVAAEQRSFRKAAHSLHVQASSVSRGIRSLEDEIGASLFQRCQNGVMLTEAGKSFLAGARQIIFTLEREARTVSLVATGKRGRVIIGVSASLGSPFLSHLLEAYALRHSEVQLDFIDGRPERHVAGIRQGSVDVAFVAGLTDWLECDTMHLWSERAFVALPARHRLNERSEVTWRDLITEAFLVNDSGIGAMFRRKVLRRFRELGHQVDIHQHSVGRETLLALVAMGHGFSLTTESLARIGTPGLIFRPLQHEMVGFSAVWSPRNDNPALRRLLSVARTLTRDEPGSISEPNGNDVGGRRVGHSG